MGSRKLAGPRRGRRLLLVSGVAVAAERLVLTVGALFGVAAEDVVLAGGAPAVVAQPARLRREVGHADLPAAPDAPVLADVRLELGVEQLHPPAFGELLPLLTGEELVDEAAGPGRRDAVA